MQDLLSQRLSKLRSERELTFEEVGTAIGKSPSTINLIGRGQRNPSLPTLIKLAEFFEAPLEYLLEEGNEELFNHVSKVIQNRLNEREIDNLTNFCVMTGINYFHLKDTLSGNYSLTLKELKLLRNELGFTIEQLNPRVSKYKKYVNKYLRCLLLDENSINNIINYIDENHQ